MTLALDVRTFPHDTERVLALHPVAVSSVVHVSAMEVVVVSVDVGPRT